MCLGLHELNVSITWSPWAYSIELIFYFVVGFLDEGVEDMTFLMLIYQSNLSFK